MAWITHSILLKMCLFSSFQVKWHFLKFYKPIASLTKASMRSEVFLQESNIYFKNK